ncbi:phytanoyl-CoA dioxygenase family protein [Candidatus Thioglobus sp. NP1]|jgi:non-heme Fe2+,alpha-ketoglutarate-dependent halogenase|uniref:phytanoyl-CoA dioxygenase family protein n=1 Tax=Candidatus Thioglobus sp. NP1 TaxID=2508687 RepID=UPI000DEDC60C|nr:phytanoyl-CoA dioxygenase family protein [Candidatus Thioglobus sp. NP1]AXE62377.1 phytanoyl-CoA dioxygenase [Candidatus Thioglobus sp. NP1]|tara:strand:- start:1554 stop:2387 length:834 start_codon:yes stop_codon:yes gene_type:complete
MPKVLTKEQIEQYHDEGFIAPVRVISENEALSIKNQLEQVEADFPDEINAQSRNNLHLSFAFLDALAHNTIIVDAMEDLIGPDIALWASVMFIKEPSSKQYVSWHQDATYMGLDSIDFPTPWIALSPSNRDTGCMTMISGSHHSEIQIHKDTFAENNILTRGQVIPEVDKSKAIDLILEPGEMSIHHGAIIHGSQPNNSDQRRIGFSLQSYVPPSIKQVVGKNIWTHIRGKKRQDNDGIELDRPKYNMDPITVEQRRVAEENLSKILYKGAKIKRKY